jgi:hypothetical protein
MPGKKNNGNGKARGRRSGNGSYKFLETVTSRIVFDEGSPSALSARLNLARMVPSLVNRDVVLKSVTVQVIPDLTVDVAPFSMQLTVLSELTGVLGDLAASPIRILSNINPTTQSFNVESLARKSPVIKKVLSTQDSDNIFGVTVKQLSTGLSSARALSFRITTIVEVLPQVNPATVNFTLTFPNVKVIAQSALVAPLPPGTITPDC